MLDTATESAFLQSIIAHPDDDAPRLIYADWLDENGDADRAEFIRLQIQLSQMPRDAADREPIALRCHELRQEHHMEWVNRLPQFSGVHWEIFDRGFISAARFDGPDAYFANESRVFAAAPITELRIHQFSWPNAIRLADSRHLRRVRTLDFHDGNRIANNGIEGLMKSSHVANLTSLNLSHNSLGSAGVRAIAMAPYLRSLIELRLDRNDLYDDAMRFLAESQNLARLQVLDMDFTRTGDDGIRALANSKHLKSLRMLFLSNNQITDAGLTELVRSDVMSNVHTLFLYGNSIGDAGIIALTKSPNMNRLKRLYVTRNPIRDDGAFALARWHRAPMLRELHIGNGNLSGLAKDELRSRLGRVANIY